MLALGSNDVGDVALVLGAKVVCVVVLVLSSKVVCDVAVVFALEEELLVFTLEDLVVRVGLAVVVLLGLEVVLVVVEDVLLFCSGLNVERFVCRWDGVVAVFVVEAFVVFLCTNFALL